MSNRKILYKIAMAIRDYYQALDNHQHGGVAQDKAIRQIEKALGMRRKDQVPPDWHYPEQTIPDRFKLKRKS